MTNGDSSDDIGKDDLISVISDAVADYSERISGARRRLINALEIIVVAYYAALIKRRSDEMLTDLMSTAY